MQRSKIFSTVLLADAASCAILGSVFAAGAAPLARLTALPEAFLIVVGLVLLPIAALIGAAAGSPVARSTLAPVIVFGNVVWVAASLAILVFGLVEPNALGVTLILGQAAAVAVLTVLEAALMRPAPAMALR